MEADLYGDSSPDLQIRLAGLVNLSAANFALTPAQSTADVAAGANLGVTRIAAAKGSAVEYAYSNVQGRSYTSYDAIYSSGTTNAAEDLNLSSSSNELDLNSNNLTIVRGSGTETFSVGTDCIEFDPPSHEIQNFRWTGQYRVGGDGDD